MNISKDQLEKFNKTKKYIKYGLSVTKACEKTGLGRRTYYTYIGLENASKTFNITSNLTSNITSSQKSTSDNSLFTNYETLKKSDIELVPLKRSTKSSNKSSIKPSTKSSNNNESVMERFRRENAEINNYKNL